MAKQVADKIGSLDPVNMLASAANGMLGAPEAVINDWKTSSPSPHGVSCRHAFLEPCGPPGAIVNIGSIRRSFILGRRARPYRSSTRARLHQALADELARTVRVNASPGSTKRPLNEKCAPPIRRC